MISARSLGTYFSARCHGTCQLKSSKDLLTTLGFGGQFGKW